MQFLFPAFLWALLALSIPVIIHLFYFRRFKKVQFTNVRLLKEIKEETASRNKLKDLLILLSRLLALLFLILAFAQPFIPKGESVKTGQNLISVFVDNSFSMSAENNQTPLIDIAKNKAMQIVQVYDDSDLFQVITHDFEGKHQRLISKEDALGYIEDISISPSVKVLSQILNRQKQLMENSDANHIIYLISDFQVSMIDQPVERDSAIEINFLPVRAVQENNIAIDSAWLEAGVAFVGQGNRLIVRIKNYGRENAESVRLSIFKDGQEKPEGIFNIAAGETITDTIVLSLLSPGWHTAEIKISDYPIQFDDHYFISFYVDEDLNVLSIHEGRNNRYLQALFNGLEGFDYQNTPSSAINYGEINRYDLIIIHGVQNFSTGMNTALSNYINEGGKILLFPELQNDLNSINLFLNNLRANTFTSPAVEEVMTVTRINTQEFIFKDVFENTSRNLTLPSVKSYFRKTNIQSLTEETLMTFRNGYPYLQKYQRGNGILYVCSSPLDEAHNDLVQQAEVFVPMVYKMAIAKADFDPLSYTIGKNTPITVNKSTQGSELVYRISGDLEFIPSQTSLGSKILISENNQVRTAGLYHLTLNNQLVKKLAFNYDRLESNVQLAPMDDLNNQGNVMQAGVDADLTQFISQKDKGIVLWRWCLILALIFLLMESLLLRFLKK